MGYIFLMVTYFLLLFVFVMGNIIIVYHLLTFRLNKNLALFTSALLLSGSILLLIFNIYYFLNIDWQEVSILIF